MHGRTSKGGGMSQRHSKNVFEQQLRFAQEDNVVEHSSDRLPDLIGDDVSRLGSLHIPHNTLLSVVLYHLNVPTFPNS